MLREWVKALMTPCPPILRKMGYLQELIAMEARYHRCSEAWQSHLEQSRRLILEVAQSCRSRRKIVVMGSGFLYDVPLAELSALFEQVILVDILHFPQVQKVVRAFPQVQLLSADVTGCVEPLFQTLQSVRRQGVKLPLPVPHSKLLLDDPAVDLVLSLNLLSQLPLLPQEYMIRAFAWHSSAIYTQEEMEAFGRAILQAHVAHLLSFQAQVCVIADLQSLLYQGETLVEQEEALLIDWPYAGEEWIWKIAPAPEIHPRYSRFHRVRGIRDLHQAQQSLQGNQSVSSSASSG